MGHLEQRAARYPQGVHQGACAPPTQHLSHTCTHHHSRPPHPIPPYLSSQFGLEHWGTDDLGVARVRKFLLEWLSFLHRYVPVGLLERLPGRLQDRPPAFVGRDDLETLMASPSAADWVRITEMLLGPVPDNYSFTPKHKANAYDAGPIEAEG